MIELLKMRLLSKANTSGNGCLEYPAPNSQRYGFIRYKGKKIRVNRASWLAHYGSLPEGLCVCHKCDNPRCINPEHLFLGTHQDNMDDRGRKGRSSGGGRKGESHGMAKLTPAQVIEIRQKRQAGMRAKEICALYGVQVAQINRIIRGATWKHLLEPNNKENLNNG